jgi:hypothetical protein
MTLLCRLAVVLLAAVAACTDDAGTTPTTSGQASATSSTTEVENSSTTTSLDVGVSEPITRPITDPSTCEARVAREATLGSQPLRLFAVSQEAPIPVQIIGRPGDASFDAFALVERFFESDLDVTGAPSIEINGATVGLSVYDNGNAEARWKLPDGSFGYLRSRGLDRAELVTVLEGLSPRDPNADVPGFDFKAPSADANALSLLHEHMNTGLSGTVATVECVVAASGFIYRIISIDADPVAEYALVIDRPVPLEVGVREGRVIIIDGRANPHAPTLTDVANADAEEWSRLLDPSRS